MFLARTLSCERALYIYIILFPARSHLSSSTMATNRRVHRRSRSRSSSPTRYKYTSLQDILNPTLKCRRCSSSVHMCTGHWDANQQYYCRRCRIRRASEAMFFRHFRRFIQKISRGFSTLFASCAAMGADLES